MSSEARPPRLRRRSGAERLRDALIALANGHGTVMRHEERAWASVTFAGARHRITLEFAGEDAVAAGELLVAELPDHEFAVPGQLVADANIIAVSHRLLPAPQLTVDCELLMVEEA